MNVENRKEAHRVLEHNDQAHPKAERGTNEAVGGRVQRLIRQQLTAFNVRFSGLHGHGEPVEL